MSHWKEIEFTYPSEGKGEKGLHNSSCIKKEFSFLIVENGYYLLL